MKLQLAVAVIMECVGTAIVVAIVATLMLLGIGMVVNQLLRLRKWLNAQPPEQPPGEQADHPLE
ncbi:hypothetical protein AWB90_10965 [Mycobacterium paraense]|uniref:Uncharacterized protein n=1 Tax=Mycobacterium paraense TaxID=767916 RepID=A0A1X2ACS9_9MYCO|nr:hypothetical protein AWB90_10965 [Mycobacterium paraense]